MISNADIKFIRSLKEKKFRTEYGLFVIEGEKMLSEARASGFEIVAQHRIEEIGENAMSRICSASTPPPVLAVVRIPQTMQSIDIDPDSLCLALDGVRDPGNMGTIIRTADWFGIPKIYASQDSVEFYNPKVVAATMGSIFRISCIYCDIPSICARFREQGSEVYGTFLDGEDLYEAELTRKGLIVMGNESVGISAQVGEQVSKRLRIPSFAQGSRGAESLNVAVATAVTLSEFRRR